jgi:hypothetical protein
MRKEQSVQQQYGHDNSTSPYRYSYRGSCYAVLGWQGTDDGMGSARMFEGCPMQRKDASEAL